MRDSTVCNVADEFAKGAYTLSPTLYVFQCVNDFYANVIEVELISMNQNIFILTPEALTTDKREVKSQTPATYHDSN